MPTPRPGETEDEFMKRCIPQLIEDEGREQDQAVAMCASFWEEAQEGKTMKTNGMEHKVVPFVVEALNTEGRTVEGYASVFGNVDQGSDIVHAGAFTKTLQERADKVKFLYQHNPGEPLGRPLEIREDGRGLFFKAVISDTAKGRDVLALLRDGAIDGMSIGYEPVKGGTDFSEKDGMQVRNLRELKLHEVSLVTFPMNEDATVTALKEDDKGVSGSTDLPLAPRSRAWDATAAEKRVRSWAGADDAPNAKYRRAFFWYDSSAADQFGSYKLPFADVINGTLTAIPRGIFAVAGALRGARGGPSIPAADQSKIKSRVNGYYARMRREFDDDSIVPPWEKAMDGVLDLGAMTDEQFEAFKERVKELNALFADAPAIVLAATDTEAEPEGEPPTGGPDAEPLTSKRERALRELEALNLILANLEVT